MDYIKLVEVYEKLEKTTKRLTKTYIISELLKETPTENLRIIMLLLQGKLFPPWDERKIGVASKLVIKAIATATGMSTNKVEEEWKKTGDLGDVAENLVKNKRQVTLFSKSLIIEKVFDNLRKMAVMEGAGTVDRKIQLISELLTSAKPMEAKYIIRTILEELRIGVGEGSLRDAICWAFFYDKIKFEYNEKENDFDVDRELYNKYIHAIQNAYDVINDFSVVAEIAKKSGLKGLQNVDLEPGRPIKVMLALKVKDIGEGFERCGKRAEIEYKYDGFRIQAHKFDKEIKLFTRRLENVTKQFPEVVNYFKNNVKADSFIIDSESVGYDSKTQKYMPFQNISQRIKRKYDIAELEKELPVEVNVFDIVYYNGKNLINEPFVKRRKIIEKIVKQEPKKIVLAKNLITSDKKEVEKFYNESLQNGNEGIMFKALDAPYKPGARVGFMVKLKGEQEGVDIIIIAAEWGEGKRATWLSSFTMACIDEDGNFLEIGKVGTGIKEKSEGGVSFEQLTEELKPLILSEKGRNVKVKPQIVVEVTYEEIQKSPTYSSGFALRFPRFKQLRLDRGPEDIVTLHEIEDLYYAKKKR